MSADDGHHQWRQYPRCHAGMGKRMMANPTGLPEELIIARFPPELAGLVRHRIQNDQPLDGFQLQMVDTLKMGLGPDQGMAYGRVRVDP